mmetsp:Transcript_113016/g.326581  ORF Transcript_113016/g.326581 Transcript_113016/m.326581 type:complete len:326 (+) Transcript_113016:3124-4101(+)
MAFVSAALSFLGWLLLGCSLDAWSLWLGAGLGPAFNIFFFKFCNSCNCFIFCSEISSHLIALAGLGDALSIRIARFGMTMTSAGTLRCSCCSERSSSWLCKACVTTGVVPLIKRNSRRTSYSNSSRPPAGPKRAPVTGSTTTDPMRNKSTVMLASRSSFVPDFTKYLSSAASRKSCPFFKVAGSKSVNALKAPRGTSNCLPAFSTANRSDRCIAPFFTRTTLARTNSGNRSNSATTRPMFENLARGLLVLLPLTRFRIAFAQAPKSSISPTLMVLARRGLPCLWRESTDSPPASGKRRPRSASKSAFTFCSICTDRIAVGETRCQ